jgi:F-type H+-transporting ATPase subunit b
MDETLRQLGEIALSSIPTIIIFMIVYACYRMIVHKPLAKVLQERYERTEGAVQRARADIAAAEAKTSEYEQRLREARMTIFKSQETRRQAALAARAEAVRRAREQAAAQVSEARAKIAAEAEGAKAQLLPEIDRLASQVMQSVLKPVTASAGRP